MKKVFFQFLAVGLLLASGCRTTDPVTGRRTYNMFSISDDISMGESMLADVREWAKRENIPMNQDAERLAQLERIMWDIAAVSHLPDLPYEVLLLHSDTVNALALPGGKFIVFEGLYDGQTGLVRDENELAAVMAHEIAHVNCRHSTEALTRHLPAQLLVLGGLLYAEYKDKDDLVLVFGGAFLFYNGLVVTNYSRKDEREADRVGLMYMAHAGYDPRAALRLWRRAAENESSFDRSLSFLSTHPPSRERARNIEKRLPEAMLAYEQSQRPDVQVATSRSQPAAPVYVALPRPAARDVPAAAPSRPATQEAPEALRLNVLTPSVRPGEKIVAVHSAAANIGRSAWIGFYDNFAARDKDYLHYTFLANLTDRTYDVIAPERPGSEYHFRIFPTEGYDGAVRSGPVEVR